MSMGKKLDRTLCSELKKSLLSISRVKALSRDRFFGRVWRTSWSYRMPEIMAVSATALASFPRDVARSTTALISALLRFCSSSRHSLIQIC